MKTTLASNGAMSYDLSKFDNRIIVAGTRKYNDYDSFSKTITDAVSRTSKTPDIKNYKVIKGICKWVMLIDEELLKSENCKEKLSELNVSVLNMRIN
jgi:hypothetical protein